MKQRLKQNRFAIIAFALIGVLGIVDYTLVPIALNNTLDQIISMLLIVPPIFLLIGLFDAWVPRQTVIALMGNDSGVRGMALAFLLGAFSAGPIIAAFPLALVMIKKGARYANVMFFLMVWSSLKLPIVFFQITQLGFSFAMLINAIMFVVFIAGALLSEKVFNDDDYQRFEEKAANEG